MHKKMNAREMAQQVRLAQWAGVMRERNESGKSIRSWCIENGINQKTFHYWQRKLRDTACERVNELQGTRQINELQKTSQTGLILSGFTQVAIQEKHEELPSLFPQQEQLPPALPSHPRKQEQITKPPRQSKGQISMEVGGLRITTDSAYPTNKLTSLLRELIRT